MTALLNRIKDSLGAEPKLNPTLAQRLDKLAEDLKAPATKRAPIFN